MIQPVPLTIHRQLLILEHPDTAWSVNLPEWSFAPREASESVSSRTGILRRRTASEPVQVLAPGTAYLERGRLSVSWDREHGLPAELVWSAAMNERHGFSMASKAKHAAGPSLFDVLGPAPAQNGPGQGLADRVMATAAELRLVETPGPGTVSGADTAVCSDPRPAPGPDLSGRIDDAPAGRSDLGPIVPPVRSEADRFCDLAEQLVAQRYPLSPEQRLTVLAGAMRRAISQFRAGHPATATAVLESGLEDAGIVEDPTR